MSLMARLGGRSNRKIPFSLFNDGEEVDPSLLAGGGGGGGAFTLGDPTNRGSGYVSDEEIVPVDPTKPTHVRVQYVNGAGSVREAGVYSWEGDESINVSLAAGASVSVDAFFAVGESYAVTIPANCTANQILERSLG